MGLKGKYREKKKASSGQAPGLALQADSCRLQAVSNICLCCSRQGVGDYKLQALWDIDRGSCGNWCDHGLPESGFSGGKDVQPSSRLGCDHCCVGPDHFSNLSVSALPEGPGAPLRARLWAGCGGYRRDDRPAMLVRSSSDRLPALKDQCGRN